MKSFAFAAFVATAAAVPAWNDWSSSDPVADETTTSTSTWADWSATSSDPVEATTTTSSTWADWDPSATSSTPADVTSTSSADYTWSDWASASSSTPVEYTTTVVTALETYCPYATKFTHAGKTYDVTEATTVTITDCPCTIEVPVVTKTTSSCSEASATPGYWNPVAPAEGASSGYAPGAASGTGSWGNPVSPYATTSAPIAAYTGAANRVANVGAGLAGVAAAAAFLL